MRWQEVFSGADPAILFNNTPHTKDSSHHGKFWHHRPDVRREKLFPFLWNVVATEGQLYGNRDFNNRVNCKNPHWFSYPGYSEMLTGFVDRRIRSNDPIENPNYTVFEFIHRQPGFENRVAAFATWEVFPFILREGKSAFPVHIAKELMRSPIPKSIRGEELIMHDLYSTSDDSVTFYSAFSFLKTRKPRVLFIGLDGTDHHAHAGDYEKYLSAAHGADQMISRLWTWLQSQPGYKNQTTILVTTDHGRGGGHRRSWTRHGRLAFGSGQAWFAVIGPGTAAYGEMKNRARYSLSQIAKTAAGFLGLDYYNVKPVGQAIETMREPGLPGTIFSETNHEKL